LPYFEIFHRSYFSQIAIQPYKQYIQSFKDSPGLQHFSENPAEKRAKIGKTRGNWTIARKSRGNRIIARKSDNRATEYSAIYVITYEGIALDKFGTILRKFCFTIRTSKNDS
jgi:hypothetical protein